MAKPTLVEIEAQLWNDEVSAASYEAAGEKYRAAIPDQYKLYTEMADRISARRALANTFFLTLNTAIFTLFGVLCRQARPHRRRRPDRLARRRARPMRGVVAAGSLVPAAEHRQIPSRWPVGETPARLAYSSAEWEAL